MKAVVAGGLSLALLISACGGGAAERRAVGTYLDAIRPIVKEGGRVVEQGVKPGIADLEKGNVSPAQFRDRANGWRREMQDVRSRLAAVPARGRLRAVGALFDVSLAGYIRAIDAFVVASTQSSTAGIKRAVTNAIPIAEQADRDYDAAVGRLKAEQQRVGLEPEAP